MALRGCGVPVREMLHPINLLLLKVLGALHQQEHVWKGSRGAELCPCPSPLALGNLTAVKPLVAKDLLQSPKALTPHLHLLPSTRLSFENAASTVSVSPGSPFCLLPEGSKGRRLRVNNSPENLSYPGAE